MNCNCCREKGISTMRDHLYSVTLETPHVYPKKIYLCEECWAEIKTKLDGIFSAYETEIKFIEKLNRIHITDNRSLTDKALLDNVINTIEGEN